ncbi:hypothetical protein PENTCL1PPCAC_14466, partial [Pristionchus entomophagus]
FSYSTTAFSCIFNSLLIYVIVATHDQDVGPYRWLILSFAVIDVCISLVHGILIPTVHMTEFGYICISNRFIDQPTAYGYGFGLCVIVVDAGWRPDMVSRSAYAPVILEVYGIDLFADNLPGFLGLTLWVRLESGEKEWQTRPLIAMTTLFGMVFASAAVIIFCLLRILKEMSAPK